MTTRTAVALLIFNRPAHTQRVFDRIARARPPRLLVVGDGPRPDRPEDVQLVRDARAVVERVDWPCEVSTCYADSNLGCGVRISSGLDWVFDQVPEAIVLEDDCVPDPSFFGFCEELLERYRSDRRVHMISGCNIREPDDLIADDYGFSRCYHIWGWATWARAWRHYDFEMRAWPALRDTDWLNRHVGDAIGAVVTRRLLDATYEGTIRQWDFQWVLAGMLQDALAVVPRTNLVTNIGYGDAATHMHDPDHPLAGLPVRPIEFPLQHPAEMVVNEERDRAMWRDASARQGEAAPETIRARAATALRRGVTEAGRARRAKAARPETGDRGSPFRRER